MRPPSESQRGVWYGAEGVYPLNELRTGAKALFPTITLTLVSIVQALALEKLLAGAFDASAEHGDGLAAGMSAAVWLLAPATSVCVMMVGGLVVGQLGFAVRSTRAWTALTVEE